MTQHSHGPLTHDHAGEGEHSHVVRALCFRHVCRGYPTHDVHDVVGAAGKLLREGKELPDIEFPWPDCPVCDGDLEHTGDAWHCEGCATSWHLSGSKPSYDPDGDQALEPIRELIATLAGKPGFDYWRAALEADRATRWSAVQA